MKVAQDLSIEDLKSKISEKLTNLIALRESNEDTTIIEDELWILTKRKFIMEAAEKNEFKKFKGIIYSIGFSPQPIILSILANNPEYVFFIHTKESEKYIDEVIKETDLGHLHYKYEDIKKDSIADSYRLVKRGLNYLSKKVNLSEIALDATGGTKSMSIGFGIAATVFNLNLIYVTNSNYNPKLRRPEPGSEKIIYIDKPIELYLDDRIKEGLNSLKTLNFNYANKVFNHIKDLSVKKYPGLLANITQFLYLWDSLDYSKALKFLRNFKVNIEFQMNEIPELKNYINGILDSWEFHLTTINDQIEIGIKNTVENEKISPALIMDVFTNAEREFYKKSYNNAGMKYYRTVEMINQYRLFNKYNINTQNPEYENLPEDTMQYLIDMDRNQKNSFESIILNQYNEIWSYIYKDLLDNEQFRKINLLPRKIGCLAGIIIRSILGDIKNRELISRVYYMAEKRNDCYLAHGIDSISKKNCDQFKEIAEQLVNSLSLHDFCKNIEFTQRSIDKLVDSFIKII